MRVIFRYVADFTKEHFHGKAYLWAAGFLALTITFNYWIDFEDSYLDRFYRHPLGYLFYTGWFAFAYFGMALPQVWLKGCPETLTCAFWWRSACFIAVLGLTKGFYHHEALLTLADTVHEQYFLRKLLRNLSRVVLYLTLLWGMKWLLDRQMSGLYGLNALPFTSRPYWLMLAAMVPLLVWASFQPAFLQTYPMFKPWQIDEVWGLSRTFMALCYETGYALSFVGVELMFRGALVIGMASVLGKDAVLPMVTAYAFLHFGKPLPETLGSIAGGYLLGIFAYYSRSIWGGCLIHVGVALLMDALAYAHHLSRAEVRDFFF
jgi:hypothetical protein